MSDYSLYLIYGPMLLGLLALLLAAFTLHDLLKSLPKSSGAKPTPAAKWERRAALTQALSQEAPRYAQTMRGWIRLLAATALVAAAGIGAFVAEVSGWNGTYYCWLFWLLAFGLAIWATVVWRQVVKVRMEAMANLKHHAPATYAKLGLHLDGRWSTQLMGTAKYLIAAEACLLLSCAMAVLASQF